MTVAITDGQVAVQMAIFSRLSAASYFTTNSIPILDNPPKDQEVPFVTIGDMTTVDYSTVGTGGQVISLMIHTWDQSLSSARLKNTMAAIITLLHDTPLSLPTGLTNVNIRYVNSQTIKDPDGFTMQGVQKFRIVVQTT